MKSKIVSSKNKCNLEVSFVYINIHFTLGVFVSEDRFVLGFNGQQYHLMKSKIVSSKNKCNLQVSFVYINIHFTLGVFVSEDGFGYE